MGVYEWKVVKYAFVLHRDGEPTDVCVLHFDGNWQGHDDGGPNLIHAKTPDDAMDIINGQLKIEAPHDGEAGRLEIVDYLRHTVSDRMGQISDSIVAVRNDLQMLDEIQNDAVYSVGYRVIGDTLLNARDTVNRLGISFRHQEQSIDTERGEGPVVW